MKRTNLHLPEQTITALKRVATETGLTVAEIVRRAVDAYLKRANKS